MVVQLISGTRRRNATNFKLHIVEGSQSHAAYESSKLLFFEDVDIVFKDEADFYPQLLKLLHMTKVPVVLSATSYIHLLPIMERAGI